MPLWAPFFPSHTLSFITYILVYFPGFLQPKGGRDVVFFVDLPPKMQGKCVGLGCSIILSWW